MRSVAVDYTHFQPDNVAVLATSQPPLEPGDSWIEDVMDSLANNGIKKKLSHAARVHPCIIDGNRVLVYEKGLKEREPEAYSELVDFAAQRNFSLKEDRRDRQNQGLSYERRRNRVAPMVLLAGGILLQGAAQAGGIAKDRIDELYEKDYVFPQVQVIHEHNDTNRSYLTRDGKHQSQGLQGEIENILAIASKVKNLGSVTGVSTHNISMPSEYVGGFIHRYDYQFDKRDGGGIYSFYEGEGFGALGYYSDDRIIMDVLIAGNSKIQPKVGGPFDQVLYDNHRMELISYDHHGKHQSFLKASYSIGITSIISL